jgi:cytoskeletal protein CcmA (bactofilin family)
MESPLMLGDKGEKGERGEKADSPTPGGALSTRPEGAPARPTEINALLGRGTHFEGKLFFEGRVRVDGSFNGEIRGEDVLVIGEGARVVGRIFVATCIVTGGEVEADIRARDAIELYAPSKVMGSLHSPAIFIDRGVQFDGSCKMAPLDEQPGERERERGPGDRVESRPVAERALQRPAREEPLELPALAPSDEDLKP